VQRSELRHDVSGFAVSTGKAKRHDIGTAGACGSSNSGGAAGHQISGPAVPTHIMMHLSAGPSGGRVRPGLTYFEIWDWLATASPRHRSLPP
jgi:hypothetical protein